MPNLGPNDLRLGVSTLDQKCETCGETRECQGHFGHIKLNEPVFHYGFMEFVEKDDITAAYVRIVSINTELKGHNESSDRNNKVLEMEKIIASIMVKVDKVNLQRPGAGKKKKTLKSIKSIEERLKSK
ncbi:unnamed protein product [Sphagnum balticum]